MAVSLVAQLRDTPLAFVDVETTGASPERGDRVIELGIARVEGGAVVREFQKLVDPRRPISEAITHLTGITPEMCAGQPEFGEVMGEALGLMRGAIVVGHNVPFDLGFLRNEFRRAGTDLAEALPGAIVVDTLRLARKQLGRGGNGLQKLAARFDCTEPTAHRALADCLTTFKVFDRLIGGGEGTPATAGRGVVGGGGGGGWGMMVADLIQLQGGLVRLEGKPAGKREALPLGLEPALERGLPVEMEYVDVLERRSVRVVTPMEVRKFRGEMILLAWCGTSQERRTFKLSRIVRLSRVDLDSQVGGEGEGTEARGRSDDRPRHRGTEGRKGTADRSSPGVIRGSELGK